MFIREFCRNFLSTWNWELSVFVLLLMIYRCSHSILLFSLWSKVFAKKATCGKMNICRAAFDYNTGRLLFILWIKPRGPIKIWTWAAFGPRARFWTCLTYNNIPRTQDNFLWPILSKRSIIITFMLYMVFSFFNWILYGDIKCQTSIRKGHYSPFLRTTPKKNL